MNKKPKIAMGDLENVTKQWIDFVINHEFTQKELELIEVVLVKLLDRVRRKMKGDDT